MRLWPFTNFHELNADWILQTLEELKTQITQALGGIADYASRLLNVETTCNTLSTAVTDLQQSALRFTAQILSTSARAQARSNIKAVGYELQNPTADDQEAARINIGAVSADTLSQQIGTRLPVDNPVASSSLTVQSTASAPIPPTLTLRNHLQGATYYSQNEVNTTGMQCSGKDEYGVYYITLEGGIDSDGPNFRVYNSASGASSTRVPLRNIATPVDSTDAVPLDYISPIELTVRLSTETEGVYSGATWAQLQEASAHGRAVAFSVGDQRIVTLLSGSQFSLFSSVFYASGAALCAEITADNQITLLTL